MKRILTALLALCIGVTFWLAACSNEMGEIPEEWGNVFVVYYSATGKTEEIAGYISEATGGDVFEIQPAEPYTSADLNWSDENSRVSIEHENEELQNNVELVSATPANWAEYDTVFIGYPIWWGIAAWPVNGFVTENDFMGKNIVPFCTSLSSGMGDSGRLLANMAGEGNWLGGRRFRSNADENAVTQWLQELGVLV